MKEINKKSIFNTMRKLIYKDTFFYKVWVFITSGGFRFIRNTWNFRKELYEYQKWDWLYQISLLRRGLELQSKYFETHGYDDDKIKYKKISKINRAVYILKCHEEDSFIELAEAELGYKYKEEYYHLNENKLTYEDKERNAAINKKSFEIEDILWVELLEIFDGQDLSQIKSEHDLNKIFNGSGIKGWFN